MGDVGLLPAKDRLWRQHDSRYKNTTKAGKERWKKSKSGMGRMGGRDRRREGMRVMDEGAMKGGGKKQERLME